MIVPTPANIRVIQILQFPPVFGPIYGTYMAGVGTHNGRGFDERAKADCVISFDVLEHVYIADVENILDDIFSYAKKLVILNIACYPANAMLPNGENAHITVRDKFWWKAQLDICALKYPNIHIQLLTSRDWRKTESFPVYRGQDWLDSDKFVTS